MKRFYISFIVIILMASSGIAQMQFNTYELNINAPEYVNVYKRYMEGKTFLGFNGGISVPFGDYSTNVNIGLGLGVQAKYFISDHFVFGASFNYFSSSLKDDYLKKMDTLYMVTAMEDTSGLKVISTSGSSTLYPFTLNFEYYFNPKERFKPYVGLGLGFFVVNHSLEVTTNKEKPDFFREVESKFGSRIDSYFGLSPYAGFMIDFNELISMNFDIRYNQMFSTPVSSALSINTGLIFNLAYKY